MIISKINSNLNTSKNAYCKNNNDDEVLKSVNPNFKNLGGVLISGIQACERMPMVNVAVIDMLSAILPRTIVESMTNLFAGFEAFRRESSGLIVNCMIPGVITCMVAKLINNKFLPNGTNLSNCWADSSLINKIAEYHGASTAQDKTKDILKNILSEIQGVNGKEIHVFKNILSKDEIEQYTNKLVDLAKSKKDSKSLEKDVARITDDIVRKTHISENVKIDGEKVVKASSVKGMLLDSVKFLKEFEKCKDTISIQDFAVRSKKLVKAKSLIGLGIILPLAMSMQYINRWITGKVSGVKGAPIYDDFGKKENQIMEKSDDKRGLLRQKIISISSMLGVSLLSMMKMPSMHMLEFKGIFPTMDQARLISTATFTSRMGVAEDKNELAESTVRDIATFSGLYFLGDYAAKATASIIQKTKGIILLNESKKLSANANILQKFIHWVKDTNIKSSDEVVSKTELLLKSSGKEPTKEQLKIIAKEIMLAKNYRTACQIANLGVSLILLGIIVPIYTRRNTQKKHQEALRLAQQKQLNTNNVEK